MLEQDRRVQSQAVVEPKPGVALELLSFGAIVRLFRQKAGLSQAELARLIKARKSTISDLERESSFPKPETVAKLIPVLGLDSDGIELNTLSEQYKKEIEGRKQRKSAGKSEFMSHLEQHIRDHPNQPINLSKLAKELKVASVTVKNGLRDLQALNGIKLPPGIRSNEARERLVARIKIYRRAGWGDSEIAEDLGLTKGRVRKIIDKLIERGEVQRFRRQRRTKEEITKTDLRVKELHNQGLTIKQIAQELNEPSSRISDTVNRLRRRGEAKRRVGRKTEQELEVLDLKVKSLRDQGLTRQQIVDQIGEPDYGVERCISRLIRKGLIQRTPERKPQRKPTQVFP